METILGVVANFIVQALDKSAKSKLLQIRAFVLIETSKEFIKFAYSANATEDADDTLQIRANSPGMAKCLTLKEPIIVFVPEVPDAIRLNQIFKHEYLVRPQRVKTVYAIPIFTEPAEWSKEKCEDRSKPIAALVIDSEEDIRYLLQEPAIEDRLATYAQICGEYLRGETVRSFGLPDDGQRDVSELTSSGGPGFSVSNRKSRILFQDDETVELVERIEARTH